MAFVYLLREFSLQKTLAQLPSVSKQLTCLEFIRQPQVSKRHSNNFLSTVSEGSSEKNINLLLCINVIIGIMIIGGNAPPAIPFCDLISLISTHLDSRLSSELHSLEVCL